jgi:pimeloyl-ACP methyl ester carboxylesterase
MQLHKGVADGLSLADVTCPTLVVHSEGDPVPEEFSRLLADKIAAAEYQLINRASHFVHLRRRGVVEGRRSAISEGIRSMRRGRYALTHPEGVFNRVT